MLFSMFSMQHIPVLLQETLQLLAPKAGERCLDATLGLGGHARELLEATAPDGELVGLDADEQNIGAAMHNLKEFAERTIFLHSNFGMMVESQDFFLAARSGSLLPKKNFNIILADLGLSSPHIDDANRGFTFRTNAPLDLRFDRSKGQTAAQYLASAAHASLLETFRDFGELPLPHKLARGVTEARRVCTIRTTFDLKILVEKLYGFRAAPLLPQVFQALRIRVNDELTMLKNFLSDAPTLLAQGGRLAVISYHSLEDRIVKQTFKRLASPQRDDHTGHVKIPAAFEILTKKPIEPTPEEIERNPRSRSAKLRVLKSEKLL